MSPNFPRSARRAHVLGAPVLLVGALTLLSGGGRFAQEPRLRPPAPEIREELCRELASLRERLQASERPEDRRELGELFDDLLALHRSASRDGETVARHLLWMGARDPVDEAALYYWAFVYYLNLNDRDVIRAALPYLRAEDEELAEGADDYLEAIHANSGFEHFAYLLEHRLVPDALHAELIAWMIACSPSDALVALIGNGWRRDPDQLDVLWSARRVDEALWKTHHGLLSAQQGALEALPIVERLARHGTWWVRLYALEVARKSSWSLSAETLRELAADADPHVRSAACEELARPRRR